MRWRVETSAGATQHEIVSRLVLDRAEAQHNGVYECEVAALEPNEQLALLVAAGSSGFHGHQQLQQANSNGGNANGDKLRRLFGLVVNGEYTEPLLPPPPLQQVGGVVGHSVGRSVRNNRD